MLENIKNTFNFNVGVLGHVDSGKTSLSKQLSTIASTASFDKNPQSKERGITLDLGFSSFCEDIPSDLVNILIDDFKLINIDSTNPTQQMSSINTISNYEKVQFTLVDCPGHASLIKTVIGGFILLIFIIHFSYKKFIYIIVNLNYQ